MRKILLVLTIPFFLSSCTGNKPNTRNLIDLVSSEASIILKLDNPDLFFSNLMNNGFLKTNQEHPLHQHLRSSFSFFKNFSHQNPSLLALSLSDENKMSYSFVSRGIPKMSQLDSIKNRKVDTLASDYGPIVRYTLDDQVTYTAGIDGIFMVTDSRQTLENSFDPDRSLPNRPDLEKALRASSDKKPSVLINHHDLPGFLSKIFPGADLGQAREFSNWTTLDADLSQSTIKLNGISTASDSVPRLLNIFKGVEPAENQLGRIAPVSSSGFYSIGFQEFPVLKKNLEDFSEKRTSSESTGELLTSALEAGIIFLEDADVFAVRAIDIEASGFSLVSGKVMKEEFRGISIYEYPRPNAFRQLLEPIMVPEDLEVFTILDQFVLFSQETAALKTIISNFQNKKTLYEQEFYHTSFNSLSTEASILRVATNENFRDSLAAMVPQDYRDETANIDFSGYPLTAVQFIYQDHYAHVHAILEQNEGTSAREGIKQSTSVHVGTELASPPVFFRNHRSKGLDLAVQDQENNLYLISENGKIYWKKNLETRILGRIQEVDLFKNGRIQLAFATQNKVHVIDRNGDSVKPFPLNFRDQITQPLALFDYSKNRDYRFVVVQDREVFMFDSKGRRVKGFKFSKAGDQILAPPKHIRLGTKDYILITEASGKLHILNRTGTRRVPVRETIAFSENQWFKYNDEFISTTEEGELIRIDQNANISREQLELGIGHKIHATAKTLATISDNELTIKGKTVNLDFGLYTRPRIFYINNKLYINVTDLQAKRVFLFDSNAELLPGFPVYGASVIDLGNADEDSSLEFVVRGEDDELLLYEIGAD